MMSKRQGSKRRCPDCQGKLPYTIYFIADKNQFNCPTCKTALQLQRRAPVNWGIILIVRLILMFIMLSLAAYILMEIVGVPAWGVMLLDVIVIIAWIYGIYSNGTSVTHWHPTCVKCNYNLHGIPDSQTSTCPECGHHIQWSDSQFKHKYIERNILFQWKRIVWIALVFLMLSSVIPAIASCDRYWNVYKIGWPYAYYDRSRTVITLQRLLEDLSAVKFMIDCLISLIIGITADQIMQRFKRHTQTVA